MSENCFSKEYTGVKITYTNLGKVSSISNENKLTIFHILSKIEEKKIFTDIKDDSGDDLRNLFDNIYQMFATTTTEVFCYLALVFSENNKLNKLRLFDDLPTEEQLKDIQTETKNNDTYCVIPLACQEHFATGICIKGEFYIFDSTRQLPSTNKEIEISNIEFKILNNTKKYQSELTGTCGFWTMLLCTELANSKVNDLSDIIQQNHDNPEIKEDILKKMSRNIITLTGCIFDTGKNKQKINNVAIKLKYIINFNKIIQDVEKASKGIQSSRDSSKTLEQYTTEKKRGISNLVNEELMQFVKEIQQQPLQPLVVYSYNLKDKTKQQVQQELALLQNQNQQQPIKHNERNK